MVCPDADDALVFCFSLFKFFILKDRTGRFACLSLINVIFIHVMLLTAVSQSTKPCLSFADIIFLTRTFKRYAASNADVLPAGRYAACWSRGGLKFLMNAALLLGLDSLWRQTRLFCGSVSRTDGQTVCSMQHRSAESLRNTKLENNNAKPVTRIVVLDVIIVQLL